MLVCNRLGTPHLQFMGQAVPAALTPKPLPRDKESGRRILSPDLAARLRAHLARVISGAVNQALGIPVQPPAIIALIEEFEAVYASRPIQDNEGGSRYNDSLWLFVVTRILNPGQIIESGTHRGHTAWLFSQAAPQAAIRTYDVSHACLCHREETVDYIEADWMTDSVTAQRAGAALIFFDDHISHARRIMEAAERGFGLVLLDDNFPASGLYATGSPPVPTLDMIMNDDLPDGFEIRWTKSGKEYRYVLDRSEIIAARRSIAKSTRLPDLSPVNFYHPQSGLSVVQLRL